MNAKQKIIISELEVGTRFRVINGDWIGMIVEREGVKMISHIHGLMDIREGDMDLDIEIIPVIETPGILFIAPANVTISERTYKDLKTELRLLKGDIKCCEIEEIRPLVRHLGMGKLDASKHLLEHIETIERLLGIEESGKRE